MAKSKSATPAATGEGDANTQTPEGGTQERSAAQQSTTTNIDFATGQPVAATPAEPSGDTTTERPSDDKPQPEPAMPSETQSDDATTYTKAQVEQIIKERLKAEQKKYADYKTLKAAADELAKLKGDQDKEEKLLAEKLADAEARRQAMEIELQEQRVRNVVLAEAAKMGFADPVDAYQLVDVAQLEFDEAGSINGVTEALNALKESKPYLFARRAVQVEPANPARDAQQGRTDAQRHQEYFSGGGGDFWTGGGLKVIEKKPTE